jgi:type I restriction enzyme R subunit
MQSAFEKLRDFFHGCDYVRALDAAPRDVLPVYLAAIDHVLGQDDGWKRFRTLVKELATTFALAVPRPETDLIAPHLAFFQRAAAMIRKRLADDGDRPDGRARQRDIDAAVRQVIGGAVDADEVIDLFAVAGLDEARLDILSDEFLERVAALGTEEPGPGDAAQAVERPGPQHRAQQPGAQPQVPRGPGRGTAALHQQGHHNGGDDRPADRPSAGTCARHTGRARRWGLSTEEIAFYDALADNGSAREAMQSDTLRLMARELTEMVRRMPKLDWTQRESVRATLRRNVRRLLAKYGYPPDLAEGATALVLRQAELSTANSSTPS